MFDTFINVIIRSVNQKGYEIPTNIIVCLGFIIMAARKGNCTRIRSLDYFYLIKEILSKLKTPENSTRSMYYFILFRKNT